MNNNIPVFYNASEKNVNIGCAQNVGDMKVYVLKQPQENNISLLSGLSNIHLAAENLMDEMLEQSYKISIIDSERSNIQIFKQNFTDCINKVLKFFCLSQVMVQSRRRFDLFNYSNSNLNSYNTKELIKLIKSVENKLNIYSTSDNQYNSSYVENFYLNINVNKKTGKFYILDDDGNNKYSKVAKIYFKDFNTVNLYNNLEINFNKEIEDIDLNKASTMAHLNNHCNVINFREKTLGWTNTIGKTSINQSLFSNT